MVEPRTDPGAPAAPEAQAEPDAQIDPRDVASAGRSCSVILILLVAIVLVLCVGIALRWALLS